jgi:ABC-type Mn2+/Zn2+ transport system permease subunit
MNWIAEPFEYEFMRRALVACVLIGFTNGFLGAYVVLRRLALVADALSHSMLPGLALAAMLIGLNPGGLLLGGLFAAIFVALGGHVIASSSRVKDETAVAALYIFAFALGIALIKYARVKISLEHFLFGNVLGIADTDLLTSYLISVVTLLSLVALQRPLLLALFEASVARTQGIRVGLLLGLLVILIVLAMVSSLQAIGVLLSLGLLVLPAATIYLLCDSYAAMSWGGGVIGEHSIRPRHYPRAWNSLCRRLSLRTEIRDYLEMATQAPHARGVAQTLAIALILYLLSDHGSLT